MSKRLYRREWWWGFAIVIGIIITIDWYAELDLLGATARFLSNVLSSTWRLIVEAAAALWRVVLEGAFATWRFIVFGAERFSLVLTAVATSKVARFFTSIAASVTLEYMFAGSWTGKVRALKERAKSAGVAVRLWWLKQHLVVKLCIVITMIVLQISLHWVILLFPIGFMVPYLVKLVRFVQKTVLDNAFTKWYLKRFGSFHGFIVRTLRTHTATRKITGCVRATRLYFSAGWRIWKYDSRFKSTERSLIYQDIWLRYVFAKTSWWPGEWRVKFNQYRTRPLLSGVGRNEKKEAAE